MPRLPRRLAALLVGLASLHQPVAAQDQGQAQGPLDVRLWAGMRARSIGPAGMSGRVAALCVDPSDKRRVFVGAATGGLWRSEDQGTTFEPIFDEQRVASIGAVAVHPARRDQIWVGTGEGNPRNSASVGDGMFRSKDGGDTWERAGLENTERIHRILLHPEDPNTAWAGVLGPAWSESDQRGVWKTTDGGNTWEQVLPGGSPRTGCADLIVNPQNPDHLIAAMWEHARTPWIFESGGEHSGLFVSYDGGANWERRTEDDGLPKGDLGRIGLGWSQSDPNVVYALVEAEGSAMCRSNDGGRTFGQVNTDKNVNPRPFYFSDIRVAPDDPNTIYRLQTVIDVSRDGGRTFDELVPWVLAHPDHHDMWIDPDDGRHIWIGNDGGVYRTVNGGETWDFCENLPLAQFYHIRVDMDRPYNIYGGMQDNGSWRGPAWLPENGGIRNLHWAEIGFGDGFDAAPFPEDSMQGYAMSQQGYLSRWNLRTGERRSIRPFGPADEKLRFNWDAAFAQDPHDTGTIYYGSQFVHRSIDRGESWEIVSADLTTDDPEKQNQDESGGLTPDATGAENYTTITAIAPSPAQEGVVWAGTDDGRLHVTTDGCATWTSVEGNLPGPAGLWCQQIVCDQRDPDVAFAVFDGHRSGDWDCHVFRTDDAGLTWSRVASKEQGVDGYALSIAQDPVVPELLFVGTEFGLYVSLDAGDSWQRFDHGVPTVACRDLVIHPREFDLVIGTHGRAAYVLDDIRPLRELAEVSDKSVHLFEPPPAEILRIRQTPASRFPANTEFRGDNRPYGARLSYWVDAEGLPGEDEPIGNEEDNRVAITIYAGEDDVMGNLQSLLDSQTDPNALKPVELVARFEVQARRGLNRTQWNLRQGRVRSPGRSTAKPTDRPNAYEILPGDYIVEIAFRGERHARALRVTPDHRELVAASSLRRRQEVLRDLTRLASQSADVVDELRARSSELRETEHAEGYRALRLAAYGLSDELTILLPDGERVSTLNGQVIREFPADRAGDWSMPVSTEVDESGVSWYRCADGSRWTTVEGKVQIEAAPEDQDSDDDSESTSAALDRIADAIAGPKDPKGIPGGTPALSLLGEVRGAVSSSYNAPSSSVMRRVELATDRTQALLNEATEALLRAASEQLQEGR
ncbi:MAG: hypothetical protein AAF196_18625 [Planctomycetota bacterium]